MWRPTSILGGPRSPRPSPATWPEAEDVPKSWPVAEAGIDELDKDGAAPATWPEAEDVPKSWPVAEARFGELPKVGAALRASATSSSILFCEDSNIWRRDSGIVPARCSTAISASDSGYSFSTASRTCSRRFSAEPDHIQIEQDI